MHYFTRRLLMSCFVFMALASISLSAQVTPPVLNEGFAKGLPDGWKIENRKGDQRWVADAAKGLVSFNNTGNKTNGSVSLLISDKFVIKDYNEPILIYRYKSDKRAGDTDSLMVMYRTSETAEWAYLKGRSAKYAPEFVADTIFLSNKESDYYQIAFMAVDRLGGGIAIDSVIVRECPDCQTPVVSVYNVDMTTASLMWTECGDAVSYRLCINTKPCASLLKAPDFRGDFLDIVVEDSYMDLKDLQMGQNYYVYVRSNCANENSAFSVEKSFATLNTETIPYFENFNRPFTGLPSELYTWYYNEGDITPFITTHCSESNLASNTKDKTTSLIFGVANSYNYAVLPANNMIYTATPELVGAKLSDCQISFVVKPMGTLYNTPLMVGTMSDPRDISTFHLMDTVFVNQHEGFKEIYVSLAKAGDNEKHVAFMCNFPVAVGLSLDNLSVEKVPACDKARDINVKCTTVDDVEVSWYGTRVGEIWFAQDLLDFTKEDFGTTKEIKKYNATTNPFKISDLNKWTEYYIYVKNNCTDAHWSEPYQFRTPEKAIDDVLSFDFDSQNVYPAFGENRFPTGMTAKANHTMIPYRTNTQSPMSGKNTLFVKVNSQEEYIYLILPEMDNLETKRVSFFTHLYSGSGRVILGVMSDMNDIETFHPADTLHIINALKYHTIDMNAYADVADNGKFLVLKVIPEVNVKSVNLLLYKMNIKPIPDCKDPLNVNVATTQTEATVTWEANGASKWEVRVYETDDYERLFDVNNTKWIYNQVVEEPKAVVEGLKAGETKYYVYFKALCGDNGEAEWTEAIEFKNPMRSDYLICLYRDI